MIILLATISFLVSLILYIFGIDSGVFTYVLFALLGFFLYALAGTSFMGRYNS